MTKHNATWTEKHYYSDDDIFSEAEVIDPRSDEYGMGHYWDYPDEE